MIVGDKMQVEDNIGVICSGPHTLEILTCNKSRLKAKLDLYLPLPELPS